MHKLIDSAAQIVTEDVPGQVWSPLLDFKYAFSQLPVSDLTSSNCILAYYVARQLEVIGSRLDSTD